MPMLLAILRRRRQRPLLSLICALFLVDDDDEDAQEIIFIGHKRTLNYIDFRVKFILMPLFLFLAEREGPPICEEITLFRPASRNAAFSST